METKDNDLMDGAASTSAGSTRSNAVPPLPASLTGTVPLPLWNSGSELSPFRPITIYDILEANQDILQRFFSFASNCSLRDYINKKKRWPGPLPLKNTLSSVLHELRDIIGHNELFDPANPAMILCDEALEKALDRKALHCIQIRPIVQNKMIQLTADESTDIRIDALLQDKYEGIPDCDNTPVTTHLQSLTSTYLPDEFYINQRNLYSMEAPLHSLLAAEAPLSPNLPAFPYAVIRTALSFYLAKHSAQLTDARNPEVYLLKNSSLENIFNMQAFHMIQLDQILRQHLKLFYISV
jgi:hypothetical protein